MAKCDETEVWKLSLTPQLVIKPFMTISLKKCRMAEIATASKQEPTGIELCFCKLFLHEQNNVMIVKVKKKGSEV